MRRVSILLADDHTMICDGLKRMLEPEFEVVACVQNGRDLIKTATDLRPDLALVDVGMPMLNGLDAARELKKLTPRTKLIFLTMNPDPDLASEALRIGASGYLLKNSEGEELLRAVREALRGGSYVTPQIRGAMEESFIRDPKSLGRPKYLSARQREVLQMLAEGRPLQEIGDALRISKRTVRFHKHQIMEELGIKNNAELVHYAIKNAIIFPTRDVHL
jgi:DNA-binding NarL/FixJ family response regulator